ncbi:hypothetical protein GOBAR_AA25461 [Gossypium barbadense]|uniref:Uncharacterized protein n=1 Tax=Gossypium barbadense TaxID=3634 RepID=A0A2P5WVU5_GOSBA|nr:hypothetical protein GOBAR_AA25461 [Gossypium barbadense]
MAQTSFQETPRKNVMELYSNPCDNNRTTHEERRLQIDELDEWDETKQFKIDDKVLLDENDLRIATSKLNTNGVIPFTVLNVFSYDTVEPLSTPLTQPSLQPD